MISPLTKIQALKKCSVFEKLTMPDIAAISEIAQIAKFPQDSLIFREGDPGDKMYILVSGKVEIYKDIGASDREMKITIDEKETFGEMAILDDYPRSASARVLEDSVFITIGREEFREILNSYPEIASSLISLLCSRIRATNTNIAKILKEHP